MSPIASLASRALRTLPGWSLAALLVITLAGGLLRFDAASEPGAYQSRDEIAYSMIARSIVDKGTYGLYGGSKGQQDPIHWPPGAPALFALAYATDPQGRADGRWDVPSAYAWQAAVGTLTILAAFALVALVASPAAALLAALLVALYPPLVDASGDLLSEPLGSLLVTAALAATVLALRRPSWRAGALAGVLLAGTVLTRADLLLVPLIALVTVAAVGWSRASGRRPAAALRAVAPMAAALVVVLTPWTVFASGVRGHLVPLSSGGASNLWVGTYLPGGGSIFGSKHAMQAEVTRLYPRLSGHRPDQISQVHVISAVAARRPGMDQEAALRAEALANLREYALGDPVAFSAMMVDKVWRLWGRYTQGTYRNQRDPILALHLAVVAFGFTGLAAGIALTRRAELWMIGALLLAVTAMNAILVSEARHNLTVMPLLIAAGAIGGRPALARLRELSLARGRRRAGQAAIPVPVTAMTPAPLTPPEPTTAIAASRTSAPRVRT
jgi:hypothetical protein